MTNRGDAVRGIGTTAEGFGFVGAGAGVCVAITQPPLSSSHHTRGGFCYALFPPRSPYTLPAGAYDDVTAAPNGERGGGGLVKP